MKWYGINTDIEDRKQAEAELRRAYDSFAEAQALSHTGSFITDLVGDDHNWSEEAFRIFEFEPGSKVSVQRIRDIIHPDDLPSFESVIARGMTGENVTFAFRILTVTAAVKHVRGVAHVVEHVAGRPLFVGALQDVTESKVAEEALDRARSELAHIARAGNRVRLTVRDAGVGLDAQSMNKLFDAFFTTKTDGMGIGLSVSRSIIERHHGRLWAEPNDGPGATFAFAIPAAPGRSPGRPILGSNRRLRRQSRILPSG